MDSNESASWLRAERLGRSEKETRRKLKRVKWITIKIRVPVCPECGKPMQQELDTHARTLWKWVCPKCQNTI